MNTRGLGKNRAFIHKKLQQMMGKDFNPVIEMVKQAVKLDELAEEEPSIINCEKSIHSWSRVAEYLIYMYYSLAHSVRSLVIRLLYNEYTKNQAVKYIFLFLQKILDF